MPEIAPDTLIDGRYKVLTRIGTGGMADVFCAEDQQLGRKVALKLLHARFAGDAEFVERFRREASSAAGLQHPNVVGVYDRGEWDGTSYIAMEYLPGRTLKDVIRQEAPIDPVRAIDLTVQILKAARFAHRHGVVHRDLKPHNVIVDDEDRVKVTDFGIARAGASDMTETGSIMGTAQYLSPEQAQGHAVSPASDLYSIGVILFELLTGHVPFDAESAVTIALKHVSEPPPRPAAFDPAVPPQLETIVLWAMEKDPARRPYDADAFIAALEEARDQIVGQEPVAQRTAMFAAAPVPAEQTFATAALPPEPVAYAPAPARGGPPWWAWALLVLLLALGALGIFLLTHGSKVVVPGVVGQDVQEATTRLQAKGLDANVVRVQSGRPIDRVLAQDPARGDKVDKGSTVTLTVSGGPGDATVPSVDGLGEHKARAALVDAGLNIDRVVRQSDDSTAKGHVIRTSPDAGTTVPRGSDVTLFVSTGPQQVTVPDVTGLTQDAAKKALDDLGLQASAVEEASGDAQPGTVIRQTPAAGGTVDPGSTVTIVVAKALPQVAVPDVTGQTQADALSSLSTAKLEGRVSYQTVTDQTQDGVVLDQKPAAGSQVDQGAPVRVFVGRFSDQSGAPPAGGGGTP